MRDDPQIWLPVHSTFAIDQKRVLLRPVVVEFPIRVPVAKDDSRDRGRTSRVAMERQSPKIWMVSVIKRG